MYLELQTKDIERIIEIISQDDGLRTRFVEALQFRPPQSRPTSGRRPKIRIDESYRDVPFNAFCEEKGISLRTRRAVVYYRAMHNQSVNCTVGEIIDSFCESETIYLDRYFRQIRGIGDKGIRELIKAFGEITLNEKG